MDHLAPFDRKIAVLRATCEKNVNTMLDWKSKVADMVGTYEREGIVGPVSEPLAETIRVNAGVDIFKVLKGIADERKWIFVCPTEKFVHRYYRPQGIWEDLTFHELTIPNLKRTPALASALLLQSQPAVSDPYHQRTDQYPVEVETRARSWTFKFYGAEGEEALKHWMEAVRTDATYRIILGLE